MQNKSARLSRATAVLLLFLSLAILFALYRLDRNPILLPVSWSLPNGRLPASTVPCDAGLLIDLNEIGSASEVQVYSNRNSSFAWLNWLSQEIGPSRVFSSDSFELEQIAKLRLLVVSSSFAQKPSSALLDVLERMVVDGGALLLELPGPDWFPLSGTKLHERLAPEGRLTRVGFRIPELFQDVLQELELPVRAYRASAEAGSSPVLWLNEEPVLFSRSIGKGHVFSLALDMAHLWQTVQQGQPDEDMKVRNRFPETLSPPLETNDLVVAAPLLTSQFPVADFLEDSLFSLVSESAGLPSWWMYPGQYTGAFLMSHDEEGFGDRASWMAEYEASLGCPSTTFLVPSPALSAEGLGRYKKGLAEIGLHYVMPDPRGRDFPGSGFSIEGRYESYGFWKVQPFRRLFTPLEQWSWLQELNPEKEVARASRTHFLSWTPGYTDLFQSLVGAGFTIDSSYGPDQESRGYLFGTARPFRPLDARGLPLPILELPFVSAENLGGADDTFFSTMLGESAASTHQALSVLFHPNSFGWHPDVQNYMNWKGMCEEARRNGHWVTTFSKLERFYSERERSALYSRPVETDEHGESRLVTYYESRTSGATLTLPVKWRGKQLSRVFVSPELEKRARIPMNRKADEETELGAEPADGDARGERITTEAPNGAMGDVSAAEAPERGARDVSAAEVPEGGTRDVSVAEAPEGGTRDVSAAEAMGGATREAKVIALPLMGSTRYLVEIPQGIGKVTAIYTPAF